MRIFDHLQPSFSNRRRSHDRMVFVELRARGDLVPGVRVVQRVLGEEAPVVLAVFARPASWPLRQLDQVLFLRVHLLPDVLGGPLQVAPEVLAP